MTIASHRLFALFLCTLLLAGSAQAAPAITDPVKAGYDLAVRMDQVDTSQDSYSEAVMSINRGGKVLTRSFKTYSKHFGKDGKDEYSLIVFDRPADVNGTKYLVWSYRGLEQDDDMWVYLPAESLVRRISGSSKFASFMRSDLSNEDIQNLEDVDEYDSLLQGEENVDGSDCYILERTPKKGKETQYSRQVQWVRKDTLLRLRADYYDKKDRLVKKLFFSRQEKIGRGIVTGYDQVVTGRGQLGSERLDIAGGRHDAGAVTHSQFEILIIGHHSLLGQAVLETVTQIFSPNIRRGMRIDQQNPFQPERLRTSARINFRHPRQHQQGQQQKADISLHFPHFQNRIRQEIGSQSL